MATRIPWPGFPRGFTKSVGACVVPRTSPTAIERTSSLCTADHAPIDKTSAANASHPPKKRKLSSDTFATPETQAEVHTAPSSRANGNSTFAQPHASNKGAVKVPTTQSSLVSKLSLIGGVEVLRDLRHTLLHLSPHSSHNSLVPNQDTGLPSTSGPLDKLLSLRSTQVLSILRTELEVIEVGEQLRSASAISRPLSRCEAPAEVLRLEIDDTILDTDMERSRQDLHALLEPCGLGKSFGECHKGTIQARGRDTHRR